MSITAFINQICCQLAQRYPNRETQIQHAWWILEHVTQKSKVMLLAHPITITEKMLNMINTIVEQHVLEHKPMAYILRSIPFVHCTILTEPPVLIPRMETEEWVTRFIDQLKKVQCFLSSPLSILDLCAGSGCIAIALAKAFPTAHVTAIDVQQHAIELIKKNIVYSNVENVTVIQSDLFACLEKKPQFDFIVSNPPYIAESEYPNLDLSVTMWEDPKALCAEDQGLAIIRKIIQQAPLYLHMNSHSALKAIAHLWLEIGHAQADSVKTIMETEGYNDIQVTKDFAQKDRIVMGRADYVEPKEKKASYCSR